jgi:hypothetical protein
MLLEDDRGDPDTTPKRTSHSSKNHERPVQNHHADSSNLSLNYFSRRYALRCCFSLMSNMIKST